MGPKSAIAVVTIHCINEARQGDPARVVTLPSVVLEEGPKLCQELAG